MDNKKPFWKNEIVIIVSLLVFWPLGLFLMWKFSTWQKWVKIILSVFFLFSLIPLLFIWSLIFGFKGFSFIKNIADPRAVDQSTIYKCVASNADWGTCTNAKYNFSFEYPVMWHYVDLRPEGIGFSPSDKDIVDNFIISVGSPSEWTSEEEAKKFAKGYFGASPRQETVINGLYATKDYKAFVNNGIVASAVIVDGKRTFQFMSLPDKIQKSGITLNSHELQSIFDHMADSFSVGL